MGRLRGIGVAGLIALIAVPAIALAASGKTPVAGKWTASFGPNPQPGGFVVTGNVVKSLTYDVASQDVGPGCPTGSVTVPGPLKFKKWKLKGTRPFWAFGELGFKVVSHHRIAVFKEAPVRATLDGQPRANVALSLEFDTDGTRGGKLVRAAGILDLKAGAGKPAYGWESTCADSIGEFRQTSHLSGH